MSATLRFCWKTRLTVTLPSDTYNTENKNIIKGVSTDDAILLLLQKDILSILPHY